MNSKTRFGSWTLSAAGATVLSITAFQPILQNAVRTGENAAWMAMLLAGIVAALLFWLAATFLSGLPRGNLIDLARTAAGFPGAAITGILVAGLLVCHCGFILRETAEMAVTAVYPHTPQTFSMMALGLCALYGAWGALGGLVRLCRAFMPFMLLSVVALLAGAIGWVELYYLQPIMGPGLLPLLGGSVFVSAGFSPLVLFLLMVADRVQNRKGLGLAGITAIAGIAALLAAALAVFLSIYPLPMARSITFPLHSIGRLVSGGRFFERIEGIWILFWFFATACHLAVLFHVGALAFTQPFGLPPHIALLPMGLLVVTVGLFPPDQGRVLAWQSALGPLSFAVGQLMPLFWVLVAFLRRRWQRHAA